MDRATGTVTEESLTLQSASEGILHLHHNPTMGSLVYVAGTGGKYLIDTSQSPATTVATSTADGDFFTAGVDGSLFFSADDPTSAIEERSPTDLSLISTFPLADNRAHRADPVGPDHIAAWRVEHELGIHRLGTGGGLRLKLDLQCCIPIAVSLTQGRVLAVGGEGLRVFTTAPAPSRANQNLFRPGLQETVTIEGHAFTTVREVTVNGIAHPFTVIDDSELQVDLTRVRPAEMSTVYSASPQTSAPPNSSFQEPLPGVGRNSPSPHSTRTE